MACLPESGSRDMFGFRKNVIKTIDALLETNAQQQRINNANQETIDALLEANAHMLEANAHMRLRLDRLEGRTVMLDQP